MEGFSQPSSEGKKKVVDAKFEVNISKFLNFCIYASDAKLAHFVFSTSLDFARNNLDQSIKFYLFNL